MIYNLSGEEWRDVVGFEGRYIVSNKGRVMSLNYHLTGKEKLLKPRVTTNGYLEVYLSIGSVQKNCYVHRLVGMAFIPNPDNLPEINHKDEDKTNNTVDNLEWCNHSYNTRYGTRNKRVSEALGVPVKCIETGKIYKSIRDAQRQTGINHICQCCKGERQTTGSYHWQYVKEKSNERNLETNSWV